jgi:GMP synthase (glutamine-hydrolysing)
MSPVAERIVILDYGSQYTQLIARRIREQNVFTEIRSPTSTWKDIEALNPRGIILSGGPNSLSSRVLPLDPVILEAPVPVLGICYGMQLINHCSGGSVKPLDSGEYGRHELLIDEGGSLLEDIPQRSTVWMSHRDSVASLADNFRILARSEDGIPAAIAHKQLPLFGLQFHPEVSHTQFGQRIIEQFLQLCSCQRDWSMQHYLDSSMQDIREQVGHSPVLSLVSGGVDSTVATCLCQKALGPEQVHALYIDTGLMRLHETEEVKQIFASQGVRQFKVVYAEDEFLAALEGISDPEEKRRRIGTKFIEVMHREIEALGLPLEDSFFCQGTLYTDLIESGKGCGDQAVVIKTHHNVNPPIVEEKRRRGLIVEPNREIFKDEVRKLGELLGLPSEMVWRHPFPGPGLAIRIMGEVTSYVTRLTPSTSLMIRVLIRRNTSWGKSKKSAVIPSALVTARKATTCPSVRWSPITPTVVTGTRTAKACHILS